MSQHEKDEKLIALGKISIAAAELSQIVREDGGSDATFWANQRLAKLLDEYNGRFGEPEEPPTPEPTVREYRVSWEIALDATDPLDAGRRAYDSFVRPGSVAHVFEVTEDLDEVDELWESARFITVVDIDRGADTTREGEPVSYPLTEEG